MCKDKETPSEIGYDELDTLLREDIEHVIVCTSLTRLESHKD